ncbi:bifunctional UDP-sugar hydrolase/5'-nucleotidase UshA [Kosakonia sp. ML.JS2a]|uniref:bifunctional UDP-sugar hydrolase/5'-nucleotidase UshA n=1 Tax=Kosakonia sp. ML.JS2a TaxID=2980557 RepID=UPI0021DB4A76|nr:bifunctional UDP-sugar hydrolase/5'-nucleotidase UshA [Kosakonia sp. ML.JS2a]UXY12317.1 bifunctional UDP-sugar hydrolase/5'-nucleotidase UshA [Kosakonia sp. ML.JS2a]
MLFFRYLFILLTLPFLLSQTGYAGQQSKDETVFLTVLHTNDHHGAYWQDKEGNNGLVNRFAMIERIRNDVAAQGGAVLLLDAGDVNTGTPESDLLLAEPDFKAMAKMGYDAMTVGNHEFDNSLDILQRQQGWAGFPFLSANIYDIAAQHRAFTPYAFFEKKGLKIGVLGLTSVDTKIVGSQAILANLDFRPHVSEARKVLAEMAKEKPDVVIALTHLGYYYDGKHGSSAPGDVELARELPPGSVDVIIGGHSHTAVCVGEKALNADWRKQADCKPDRQNGIWIMQALESGRYLGRADFIWQKGQLTLKRYQLLPVVASTEAETPAVQALYTLLEGYKKHIDTQLSVPVGMFRQKFEGDRDVVRSQQTNMGQMIIAAQMDKTQADFGIISSGSIRSSISAGPVTYRDVLKVQPFGNSVTYVALTGKEIIDYLNVIAFKTAGSGAYAQFHNIVFDRDNGKVTHVAINGKPLEMDKTYRMSLPSYNATGGDGYPELNQHSGYVNTGYIDAEVLKSYIARKYPL